MMVKKNVISDELAFILVRYINYVPKIYIKKEYHPKCYCRSLLHFKH